MNTKKIWLLALVFGVVATGLLYIVIKGLPKETVEQTKPVAAEDNPVEEIETELESAEINEEEWVNEMLPVTKGKRAMTIAVTDFQGVAGYIEPGAYVDVVAMLNVTEEEKQSELATLLLQNVKVLAVGHAADDNETMKRYQLVTVEVTPEEGLTLGISTHHELYLLLREEGDDSMKQSPTSISIEQLYERGE